ncbi:MAG: P-loop NTPase fold protein, partial [Rhodobacteraceae bacterium]|nr:P-loop NTPase fold protein [Paracoccaceae bacterium]
MDGLRVGMPCLKGVGEGDLSVAAKAFAVGGASVIGQADTAKEVVNQMENRGGGPAEDPATAIERIKEGLTKIVQEQTKRPTDKVVVFIDDLDRLVPRRAVELLEAMKIFLDIDRCVYVIACDYSVVATGLKAKFGLSEGQLKGKSFFDKIIQVPFKMPIRRYQVDRYIEQLLTQIGVNFDPERDIELYCDLVRQSVGFNPRTMKRLLNTLQLLMILEEKSHDKKAIRSASAPTDDIERSRHACRVTFAILCMLERYEAIYDYLTEAPVSAERISALHRGIENGEEFALIRRKLARTRDVAADPEESDKEIDDAEVLRDAVDFVETFIECLQLDTDDSLSDAEIRHLEEMLEQSSLVSAGRKLREFTPRDLALNLRSDLNKKYVAFVGKSRPKYGKFRMRKGEVRLYLPHDGGLKWWLAMGHADDAYYFGVQSPKNDNVSKLGNLICEYLKEETGDPWEKDGCYGYRFFSQNAMEPGAEKSYREKLEEWLDGIMKRRSTLSDLCRQAATVED